MRRRNYIPKLLMSGAVLVAAMCATCARAQYNPPPERLSHVEGVVVNTHGDPVVGADVTLERDGKVMHRTKTGAQGEFEFDRAHGDYVFRVGRTQYSPAAIQVIVNDDLVALAEHKKLYVIAGPGACEDECSTIATSRREFEKALKKFSKHTIKE